MVYLFPLFTIIIWGGNSIVNKLSVESIEPSAMSFFRWFFAMLILTPFVLPSIVRSWKVIKPFTFKLAILALLGMVLNQSLGYYAALTTSVSNMALIISLVPLISIFISVPLLGKKMSPLGVVGAVISLSGLAFMLGQGDIMFIFQNSVTPGDAMMLVAAIVYALYCVLIKKWKMPLTNWQFIYMQGAFAVLMLFPLWMSSEVLLPPVESFPLVAYASLAASVIAPWLWVKSIDAIGADSSAMFMNLLPIIAVALASTLLGESISEFHIIGGIMVISGVVLAQIKKRQIPTVNIATTTEQATKPI